MRSAWTFAFLLFSFAPTVAEDGAFQSKSSGKVDAGSQWSPTHPDGDNPAERMLSLAHTDALPDFDRAELYAVSIPRPFVSDEKLISDEKPKRASTDETFPVRPYGTYADIHAHVTLRGEDCQKLRKAWQSLSFDRLGGAFCHEPVYGMRLYRGKDLLFETTVCWKCQNFYVPRYNSKEKRHVYGWYGFADDENSKRLLKLFQSLLPHPKMR